MESWVCQRHRESVRDIVGLSETSWVCQRHRGSVRAVGDRICPKYVCDHGTQPAPYKAYVSDKNQMNILVI